MSISINYFDLIVSSVKSNNNNMLKVIAIPRIVSGNPENVFKDSLYVVNLKVLGCFCLKRLTIFVPSNLLAKSDIYLI